MKTLLFLLLLTVPAFAQTTVPVQLPPITIPQFNIDVPVYDASPLQQQLDSLNVRLRNIETQFANNKVVMQAIFDTLGSMQQDIQDLRAKFATLLSANTIDDNYEMSEDDEQLVVAAPGVLANDNYVVQLNDGTVLKEKSILGPVKITITKQPEHGTVTINDDGSFVYTPHPKQAQ